MSQDSYNVIYNSYLGDFYLSLNCSAQPGVTTTISEGEFTGDRTNSTTIYLYQNGSASSAQTAESTSILSGDFVIGQINNSIATGQLLSEAHIGASLGATLELALYKRLRTYMTAVGVP